MALNMFFDGTTYEFENIVNKNKLLLYSVVYGIAGNLEADDIVQEAFIYAYYQYKTLKDKSKLKAWLCAIAKNKAYDSIKRQSHTVSIDALEDSVSNATPEMIYLHGEDRARLMSEIYSLSDKYRETMLLHYFADKSIKEISEILSVPEGTVKFRLSECRKKLKKELFDMMNDEIEKIDKKDIFAKIKEVTDKARDALKKNDTKLASDICDSMLCDIDDLSMLSVDELRILNGLYQTKIQSVRYVEGVKAVDKYLKKTVDIAEASGDNAWMSSAYSYYACELSNMGRGDESAKYYEMALKKAEETGELNIIAYRLYWCGVSAYQRKKYDYAQSYFERVLSMKDELFADKEHQVSNSEAYTLSYSAATALKGAGNNLAELDAFVSTLSIIVKTDEGFSLHGQPGFSEGVGYCEDIFYMITKLKPCLSNKVKEGYVFEQNTFSYSHLPVCSRFEVVSMNESVSVIGGHFEGCLHTKYTNKVSDDDVKLNKSYNGITDIWYAPNVGVVKIEFIPIEGNKKSYELKNYQIESFSNTALPEIYLPLSVGNKWAYEAFDFNGVPRSNEKVYENLFEVVCIRDYDSAALISHSGWGYPKAQING